VGAINNPLEATVAGYVLGLDVLGRIRLDFCLEATFS
jgi:hypothetical protein